MKTLLDIANTANLNGRVGLDGAMALDSEKLAVRYFDGQTPGGFEATLVQAYVPPVGPGPTTLTAGDSTDGFYGEVAETNLISGTDLATLVGLSAGSAMNAGAPWLKYSIDGKVLFVPQRAIRQGLSWAELYQVGLVYGVDDYGTTPAGGGVNQNTIVTIGDYNYKVRLMTGANGDPATTNNDPGSDWERMIYKVSENDPTGTFWATYTDIELGVAGSDTNYASWCQETDNSDSTQRLVRGGQGLTHGGFKGANDAASYRAWQPVLELI